MVAPMPPLVRFDIGVGANGIRERSDIPLGSGDLLIALLCSFLFWLLFLVILLFGSVM